MYGEKRLTQALTYSGGIPFAGLALMAGLGIEKDWAINAFLAYGAVIAGFMGGTVWSQAQAGGTDTRTLLVMSNIATLAAWAALIAPGPLGFGLALQAAAFLTMLGLDWRIHRAQGQPDWYFALRCNISAIVLACYALLALTA
jgi:Protein of unknown function (DUF3429)